MRNIILVSLFTLLGLSARSQNYLLPTGEYMDTIDNRNENCKSYNAYYYSVGGKYPESSETLLADVQAFCKKTGGTYTGNGYITFRFRVDCEGKTLRRVHVLQVDDNYKEYHFDKALVEELYQFYKTLDKWKVAKTKDGEPFSYLSFITYKIKNGQVINIIP